MNVLVTGGAGYLGSCLVPLLLGSGHRVRVFDRLLFGAESLSEVLSSPDCEVVEGDIRRLQEHPDLFEDIEVVVHLAGLSDEASCRLSEAGARDTNVESSRELGNRAAQANVRRFIYPSSWSVTQIPEEGEPTGNDLAYARSVFEAEGALLALGKTGLELVVLRFPEFVGLAPVTRIDTFVNKSVVAGKDGAAISFEGDLSDCPPTIHVADAAGILAHAVEIEITSVTDDAMTVGGEESGPFGMEDSTCLEEAVAEMRAAARNSFVAREPNAVALRRLMETPVEQGGEPISPSFLPLTRPMLGAEEELAVLDTLKSGWVTSGPHIAAFEEAFAKSVGAEHAVAVISCTAALHLSLMAMGVEAGDEVITSPITWPSTGNTILNMGAKPVFADVEGDTLNIDAGQIEKAITERTKVIMPVHMAGQPCDLDAIRAIAETHGLALVEDAAHALGASYRGTAIGAKSDYACFSFYATKNVTTIEGGAVALNDGDMAARMRMLAANGMTATAWERYGRSAAPGPSEVVEPGYKYLMGNINAAIGIEQLKKFPDFKETRRRLAQRYREALSDIDEIRMLSVRENLEHAWHLFIVRLRLDRIGLSRDEVSQALRRENVGTGVHFYGLHLHEYYRESLGYLPEDFPEATAASREILSLPLYPGMGKDEVALVVLALKKVLGYARRGA